MTIKHAFTSTKEDGADTTLVRPSNWNADHVITQSGARAYRTTSAQAIAHNTWTKVQLNAETYDIANEFDSTTNYRFTAIAAGYYLVVGSVRFVAVVDQTSIVAGIYKNGVEMTMNQEQTSGTTSASSAVLDIISLAATNYIELWVFQSTGVSQNLYANASETYMSVRKLL